jgi:hypothetical protein
MTTRSWFHENFLGPADVGFKPVERVNYNQSGVNASRGERLAGIYHDHQYSMQKTTTVFPPSLSQHISGGVISRCDTSWFGANASFGAVPPPDLTKAVAKLLEKWRNSTFNAGVAITEGRESAEMIIKRLKTLADSARALRRGNIGGALAALAHVSKADRRRAIRSLDSGYFANAWLELQYGWLPLLGDIHSLAELIKTEPRKGVIRSSVRETSQVCTPTGLYVPLDDVRLIVNERRRHLKVEVTSTASLPERLGLTDPATVFWESVPFSFVVDWFLPIGDALQAAHARRVMPVTSCCDTSVTQKKAYIHVRAGRAYNKFVCRQSGSSYFDEIIVNRVVYPSLPSSWALSANRVARLIHSPMDVTLGQLGSAAALARSQVGKLR